MKPMLLLAAVYNLCLAIFHMFFWKLFQWPSSLSPSGRVNSGITQVLNLCGMFIFGALAVVLFMAVYTDMPSPAIKTLLWISAAFWAFRAALQPAFFGLAHRMSKILFIIFIAGSAIHIAAALA